MLAIVLNERRKKRERKREENNWPLRANNSLLGGRMNSKRVLLNPIIDVDRENPTTTVVEDLGIMTEFDLGFRGVRHG